MAPLPSTLHFCRQHREGRQDAEQRYRVLEQRCALLESQCGELGRCVVEERLGREWAEGEATATLKTLQKERQRNAEWKRQAASGISADDALIPAVHPKHSR